MERRSETALTVRREPDHGRHAGDVLFSRRAGFTAGWLVAAFLLVGHAGSALAQNRDFTLQNNTRLGIAKMYLSSFNLNKWIRVRSASIDSGESQGIEFDNAGPCQMQLRIEFTNGQVSEWLDGFNLCKVSKITVYYDGGTRNFRARYE